jgi:hypothetical protein
LAAARVLRQNLGLLFRVLLAGVAAEKPAAGDPVDEVVQDVIAEMEREPPTAAEPATAEPEVEPAPSSASSDDAEFLLRVRTAASRKASEVDRQLSAVHFRETIVFLALLVAGFATAILALVGVALALTGVVAVAVVSGAIAVLPAAGTALLSRLLGDVNTTRRDLVARQDKEQLAAQEVEAIFAIADGEARQRQIALHAEALRQRLR